MSNLVLENKEQSSIIDSLREENRKLQDQIEKAQDVITKLHEAAAAGALKTSDDAPEETARAMQALDMSMEQLSIFQNKNTA